SQSQGYMFVDWCEKEGIVSISEGKGVSYTDEFFEKVNQNFPEDRAPKFVDEHQLIVFENLATLLYHIDRIIDKSGKNEFLVALTACGDKETYLRALREEFRSFFESRRWRFSYPLTLVINVLNDTLHQAEALKKALKELSKKSYYAAHQIRLKKKLWAEFHRIIDEIHAHIMESETFRRNAYLDILKPQIDDLRGEHEMLLPKECAYNQLKEKLENLGELCIALSYVLKCLLELADKIYSLRVTSSGRIDSRYLGAANSRFAELRESIDGWNQCVEKGLVTKVTNLPTNLSRIGDDVDSTRFEFTVSGLKLLMERIIPKISSNYHELEDIYLTDYALASWEQKMTELFLHGTMLEKKAMKIAIELSKNCKSEDNRVRPKVGVVIIKDGKIGEAAFRGEMSPGDHAEYTLLCKKYEESADLKGAILFTTLEPCTERSSPKKVCCCHILNKGIKKVWIGVIDPNPDIEERGMAYLDMHGVDIQLFDPKYRNEVSEINKDYLNQERSKWHTNIMERKS
ncbi:MAG: deaminase, partial [Nitrososphaerales archaeon]